MIYFYIEVREEDENRLDIKLFYTYTQIHIFFQIWVSIDLFLTVRPRRYAANFPFRQQQVCPKIYIYLDVKLHNNIITIASYPTKGVSEFLHCPYSYKLILISTCFLLKFSVLVKKNKDKDFFLTTLNKIPVIQLIVR